jgi:hypothetical protein
VKAVLNVGGGSKDCLISAHYAGWRHDLLDIDPKAEPDSLAAILVHRQKVMLVDL